LTDYLLSISIQPVWLFIAIILVSYLLEDLAIISAALLATEQMISVPLAFSAILIGIISGDLGLYAMGHFARQNKWLMRKVEGSNPDNRYYHLTTDNLFKNILFVRFVPGLRFIFYTACGLLRVRLMHYLSAVSLSTLIWVSFVFISIYLPGSSEWAENSPVKWLLIPLAMLMLYFFNRHAMQNTKRI